MGSINRVFRTVAVGLAAQMIVACSESPVTGPSSPDSTVPPITTTVSMPTISAISPDTGSIYGGSEVTIVGDFDRLATAAFDGVRVAMGWSPQDRMLHILHAPPHAAGRVDLVVTIPDGRSAVAAYTYVDPDAFDLGGAWSGVTVDGSDTVLEFTVRDNVLTRVQCVDPSNQSVELELAAPVVNGKVEFAGDAGRFSAWVASASEAAGTIDIAPCSGVRRWQAVRTR